MKSEEIFVGFSVAAGTSRFGEQLKIGGPTGEPNDCKVSAKDTGGAMCIFEFNGRSGGPRHAHHEQDEWIYIVEGEFDFVVGDQKMRLGPGECVFLPRKVSHVWAGASASVGKIINVYQPAGKMEGFFRELNNPFKEMPTAEQVVNKTYTKKQVELLHQFFEKYGMDLQGPPLGFE